MPRAMLMWKTWAGWVLACMMGGLLGVPQATRAQEASGQPALPAQTAWRQCAAMPDASARLACYDQWAASATSSQSERATEAALAAPAVSAASAPSATSAATASAASAASGPGLVAPMPSDGCRGSAYSDMSRFWELEDGSDCGTFRFRGYRPLYAAVATMDKVNRQPSSPSPGHAATTSTAYRDTEMRVQLSVRTKVAQGLLVHDASSRKDSLWFAYTQQSAWQLFSGQISRPFRNTDHEPELIYVYPNDKHLAGGWRWRYSGAGLVHQSNGQSLPLSRSWNRVYGMAGFELDNRWQVTAKLWRRLHEKNRDDDNPDISDQVGRAEVRVLWNAADAIDTLGLTVRHALRNPGKGSTRLEWLHTLNWGEDGRKSNLRLHTQLFSGYGDTLVDYNRRRTVFMLGLSLADF